MKYSREICTRFACQKFSAKRRGISFEFTIDEWVAWWEEQLGSNWLKKRGRTLGKYVMARWYDDGPYAPHNVKCIKTESNTNEAFKIGLSTHGVRHGMVKLTEEQARFIKYSLDVSAQECARMFNVDRSTCSMIRLGTRWARI